MDRVRPIVVVSRCVTFEHCRWNGLIIASEVVDRMKPFVDFHPVCPEKEIGLGVPRKPIRVVSRDGALRLLQSETEADVTEKMVGFARSYLDGVDKVDGFILKSRSPSCGIKDVKIYPGLGKVTALKDKAQGFFAAEVWERFGHLPIEDEGRLTNFGIREHFFTRLYAYARLRELQKNASMRALIQFHAENKFLLMSYHQGALRELGRIVANHERRSADEALSLYAVRFMSAFENQPRRTSNLNVLTHALGHFSDGLSKGEKAFFMDALDKYTKGKLPLSVPLSVVKSLIVRFGEQYLSQQTYFNPYPEDLMELKDSGEGRRY